MLWHSLRPTVVVLDLTVDFDVMVAGADFPFLHRQMVERSLSANDVQKDIL